jgi:hypothetical protein
MLVTAAEDDAVRFHEQAMVNAILGLLTQYLATLLMNGLEETVVAHAESWTARCLLMVDDALAFFAAELALLFGAANDGRTILRLKDDAEDAISLAALPSATSETPWLLVGLHQAPTARAASSGLQEQK